MDTSRSEAGEWGADALDPGAGDARRPAPPGYAVWYTTAPARWDVRGALTLECQEAYDGRPLRRVGVPGLAAFRQTLAWRCQGPYAVFGEVRAGALRAAGRVSPMCPAEGAAVAAAQAARASDEAAAAASRLLVRVRLARLGLADGSLRPAARLWPHYARLSPVARRWLLDDGFATVRA
jgi:hypothetical protein